MPKNAKDSAKARKNEQKKGYREKERERKRFTEPLPAFLETKYPHIYTEYKELYETISKKHGKKHNLTKTVTFKNWKSDIEHQRAETATTSTATTDSEVQDEEATKTVHESPTTTGGNEDRVQVVEIAMPPVSVDENQPILRMDIDQLADIMVNVEGRVDQIMGELREDPYLRQIMDNVDAEFEAQPDDEGIDISPLDDIEFDIEPFDFQAEVENYDW